MPVRRRDAPSRSRRAYATFSTLNRPCTRRRASGGVHRCPRHVHARSSTLASMRPGHTRAITPRIESMESKPQLFIVDDDVGFVHAAAEIAREEGFDITVAGTLAQGVSRLAKRRFDLALIDLSLPDG